MTGLIQSRAGLNLRDECFLRRPEHLPGLNLIVIPIGYANSWQGPM